MRTFLAHYPEYRKLKTIHYESFASSFFSNTSPERIHTSFMKGEFGNAQLTVRKYSQGVRLNSADISSDEELSLGFKLYLRGSQV
jgi:hypothetical protein